MDCSEDNNNNIIIIIIIIPNLTVFCEWLPPIVISPKCTQK